MIHDILEEKMRQSTVLIPGETLFRSYMPPEVRIGAMIRVPLTGIDIDPYKPNYYRGQFQVVTRHVSPVDGDALANTISRLLLVRSPESYSASIERGQAMISVFQPETLPIRFPSLEGNGFEWSQMFMASFTFEPL